MEAPLSDLSGKHRAEPVPPEPHRLVADIDAAFEKKILDLTERQRIADIHHHCKADDLGGTVEIAERISHPRRLRNAPTRLKPIWSDTADDGTVKANGLAMSKFRDVKTLQKFASIHASIHNHFNLDRYLNNRETFKQNRLAALAEWRQLAA